MPLVEDTRVREIINMPEVMILMKWPGIGEIPGIDILMGIGMKIPLRIFIQKRMKWG